MVLARRRSQRNRNRGNRLQHFRRRQPQGHKTAAETKQSDDTSSKKTTKAENSDFVLESKYFNDIKEVNGLETIQNPTNTLALVNKTYTSLGDYKPNDLVIPKVEFSLLRKSRNDISANLPPMLWRNYSAPGKRRL